MIVIDCPDLQTLYVPCWGELSFVASWLGLVDVFRRRIIPFRILNTRGCILQGAQKRNELVCLWAGISAKIERAFLLVSTQWFRFRVQGFNIHKLQPGTETVARKEHDRTASSNHSSMTCHSSTCVKKPCLHQEGAGSINRTRSLNWDWSRGIGLSLRAKRPHSQAVVLREKLLGSCG